MRARRVLMVAVTLLAASTVDVPRLHTFAALAQTGAVSAGGQGLDPLKPEAAPSEAALGVPIFPNAQFLRSYDAGRGQRFYVFGAAASFAEVVAFYKTVLRQRGFFVFESAPTHSFEVGRFRAETMNFPPGVTVKDFTSSASTGYPNPKPGAQPARFPTIVQIVPSPPEQ
jgi:hypothetical protein